MAKREKKFSSNPLGRVLDLSSKLGNRGIKHEESEIPNEFNEIDIHTYRTLENENVQSNELEYPKDKDQPRASPVYVIDQDANELVTKGLWFAHHDIEGHELAIQMNIPSDNKVMYQYFLENYPINEIKQKLEEILGIYRSSVVVAHNKLYECVDFVIYPVPDYKKSITSIQKTVVDAHYQIMMQLFRLFREDHLE